MSWTAFQLDINAKKKQSINKTAIQRLLGDDPDCEAVPIRGADIVPKYDPDTDNDGCYVKKQWDNNCYNYGTDIVTNTFAQPGRGTEHKWTENTCAEMRRAATSDGLQWIGTVLPKERPAAGHYATLLIWPSTNFHWVRMDDNDKWSHKPGGTPVVNTDNDGKEITDPSTQDFSPWSQFCGYMLVIPSKATLN